MLPLKDLGETCWRESNWVGQEDFEGVRRTAWRTVPGKQAGMQKTHMKGEAPSMAGSGATREV
jgi:hypothetical protein